MSRHAMPRQPRSPASARPTGPAPTIRTGYCADMVALLLQGGRAQPLKPVIASEAKQSQPQRLREWQRLLRRYAPRNDGYFRFISLDEFTTACRLRARSTALGTSMVMARRRYSLTPSVATAGALSMNLHSASTVSSSLAAGATSLTMPWLSARSGPTVAQE